MRIVGLSHRGRRILGTLIGFVALAALVVPAAEAAGPGFKPAVLSVTGWSVRNSSPSAGSGLLGGTLASKALALSDVVNPNAGDGIGPGSYLLIDQNDGNSYICTANFVWQDDANPANLYLGAAGHCFLREGDVAFPQETTESRVTTASVCVKDCYFGGQLGGIITGDLRELGDVRFARQSKDGLDVGNDFGLVEIPASLQGLVRRSVPVWGGPNGTASVPSLGQPVCLYGNAAGLGEVFATKARFGLSGVSDASAWYATIPSAPGDSGSAVVNCPGLTGGSALGILTHLATNGTGIIAGTTVAQAKELVRQDVGMTISIVPAS